MNRQPAYNGDGHRRRTREEIRVGYRTPAPSPAAPTQPAQTQQAVPQLQPAKPSPAPPRPPAVATKAQPIQKSKKPAKPEQPAVSINIQLPSLDIKKRAKQTGEVLAWPITAAHKHPKTSLITLAALIVVAGASVGLLAYQRRDGAAQGNAGGSAAGVIAKTRAVAAEPTFTPVVPASKPELGNVGAQSAFDGNHNVYSYIDVVAKQRITVSQQQPGSGGAIAAAETASKSLNANKVIATSYGDMYIYTNTKYNSQTVIASVKDLLVFLQSSQIISDNDWKSYVESLQ